MQGDPKRRWFRFSVRTLVVAVTIFCAWLGWQVSIVRERKVIRQEVTAQGGTGVASDKITVFKNDGAILIFEGTSRPLSLSRRLLGDERVAYLMLISATTTDNDVDRINDAFPESVVYFDDPARTLLGQSN